MWRLFRPAALAWAVIGVLLVAEGDALARAIGAVFLATLLVYGVRSYRHPRAKADRQAAREQVTRTYRRSLPLLRNPRLRLAAAPVVLAAALAGAAYLHSDRAVYHCPPESLVNCTYTKKPGWADPLALAVLLVGIGIAVLSLATIRRGKD